jgi:hypothetical protein
MNALFKRWSQQATPADSGGGGDGGGKDGGGGGGGGSVATEAFLMSDCDAVSSIINGHHYTTTNASTCAAAMTGGCDYDCGDFYTQHMDEALRAGLVNRSQLVDASARILTAAFLHGEFEPDGTVPARDITVEAVNSPEHKQLALEVARQAIVLLRNEMLPAAATATPHSSSGGGGGGNSSQPLLPLNKSLTRFAFIGPHANSSELLLSNYFGRNTQVLEDTPLLAARALLDNAHAGTAAAATAAGASVSYHPGVPCNDVTNSNTGVGYSLCEFSGSNTSLIPAAVAAAREAEVAVVFLGLTACNNTAEQECIEGEGKDRMHGIGLPATQLALLQAVVAVQPRTVLVLINGGPLSTPWAKAHVPAILEVQQSLHVPDAWHSL